MDVFEREKCVYVCAPMVRYSKLPFRELVQRYGCHMSYTPMTLASDFILSEQYRAVELQKSKSPFPVVMQFAATNDLDFGIAASLVAKHVDAVDLNCGCPQRWAIQEGIGSALLDRDPQVVFDMVRAAKRNTTLDTPITIKIRLLPESMARGSPGNLRKTIDYALQMEKSGISWIAVHGRTRRQTSDAPVDYEAIKAINDVVKIPLIANGDIFSLSDAKKVQERTGCAGVMAARGLLENPMLFSGIQGGTDWDCVNYFVDRAVKFGMNDALIFNHVIFMTSPNAQRLFTSPQERLDFINHRNILSLIDFVRRKKFEANNFIYSS